MWTRQCLTGRENSEKRSKVNKWQNEWGKKWWIQLHAHIRKACGGEVTEEEEIRWVWSRRAIRETRLHQSSLLSWLSSSLASLCVSCTTVKPSLSISSLKSGCSKDTLCLTPNSAIVIGIYSYKKSYIANYLFVYTYCFLLTEFSTFLFLTLINEWTGEIDCLIGFVDLCRLSKLVKYLCDVSVFCVQLCLCGQDGSFFQSPY